MLYTPFYNSTLNFSNFEVKTNKNTLVSGNAGDDKFLTRAASNLFFNWFSVDILFSSFVSFAFFDSYFFLFACLLPFEIKNVYSDTPLTVQAGEW